MKRYVISIGVVLAALIAVLPYGVLTERTFGQDEETPAQKMQRERREQAESMRERFQNMTPEEREKLREEMRERSGSRPEVMGYEQQLKSIKTIEEQIAKLKAAIEATATENRGRIRELSAEERTKLREKMAAAIKERYAAIRSIEQELAKFGGPGGTVVDTRLRISELQSIQKLAVEEKATKTAERLERFITRYERETQGRVRTPMQMPREGEPRQRRERPARPEKTE